MWWGRILSQPCPECRGGVLNHHADLSKIALQVSSILCLRISSLLTHGSKELAYSFAVKFPQTEEKFFLVWSLKFLWKLSSVSLPAMDLSHTLTSFINPWKTGFISGKSQHQRSWQQMVQMTCYALFIWMGMKCPRCVTRWWARSPHPGAHLTSRQKHCDFKVIAELETLDLATNSFWSSTEPRKFWYDHCCPTFALDR